MNTKFHLLPTLALVGLNLATALWGICFPDVYHDPIVSVDGWNRATLFAVDLVSLAAFSGMATHHMVRNRGQVWSALWLGLWFFSTYAHSFQVFTTGFNAKYPLHLAGFVIGAWGSVAAVWELVPSARQIGKGKSKAIAIWMILVALCLVGAWSAAWIEQLSSGFANARQNDLVRSIAALDFLMALPAFVWVGVGLWRGGFRDSPLPIALNLAFGIYMAALAVSCLTQHAAGSPGALRELPLWTILALGSLACVLLAFPGKEPVTEFVNRPSLSS